MSKRKVWRSAAFVVATLMLASGCSSTNDGAQGGPQSDADPAELESVSFLLNWTVGADHAAYFAALEKGWYEDEGIDLDITFGSGSSDTAISVAASNYDIGLSDATSVVATAGQAAPLEMVGMVYGQGPQTAWTLSDSGITEPQDFEGKTIGAPSGDAQRVLFPALASENNIDPDSVDWVNIDPGAKVPALSSGSVDIVFDFENEQPNYDQVLGEDGYNKISWRDYGVNLYGNALVTSEQYADENEELLRGFLEASYRGWQWTLENPEEAVRILHERVPELDLDVGLESIPVVVELLRDPFFAEHGLGWMDEERMCETVDVMQRVEESEEGPSCDSFYTNDYLPGIDLPEGLQP